MADPNLFVKAMAFTKTAHRDIYPAVQPTRPELSQSGKVIVITGATRGLGRGFALAFAQARARAIALLGRSAEALAETEKQVKGISPATRVVRIIVDVLDEAGIGAAFEEIVAQVGTPDVLINNAGYCKLETIAESSVGSFWKVQEVNVKGLLIVTKAFLKSIESDKTQPEHHQQRTILNLTSVSTQNTPVTMDSYTISKVALNKFTEFLAAEHPSITAINLDPGMVGTDMGSSVELIAPFLHDTVELAAAGAVWMCSGDKSFLSGRYVSVNWDVDQLEAKREDIVRNNLLVGPGIRRGNAPTGEELVIQP
ncbi:hypothetical protein ASPCAL08709 [Aspergillus calidoustus]|uniref:Uncharacterized protein n=1 Tax=Aspergillus calidoustus TaxID=454130 RepID=A0A0U5GR39_ASPCI|nr:hypothetical protein ASPCAL08709 [Aspergillus calidoustus]